MPSTTPSATPESALFTQAANAYLRHLSLSHARHLSAGADDAIRADTHAASVVRRAVVVHAAIQEIVAIPPDARSDALEVACGYLRGVASRMQAALRAADPRALDTLAAAAQAVLDGLADGDAFQQLQDVEFEEEPGLEKKRSRSLFQLKDDFDGPAATNPACCGLSCAELTRRDKIILWLYFFMVIGAAAAVTAVTVDFVRQEINPGAFIQSDVTDSLPAPVVTICLSQRGIPFSRLQLFNFTDAEQRNFRGADPEGAQNARQGPRFESAVERFWDNPDDENCNDKVGDFFPFDADALNRLTQGDDTTLCRPCYRVGSRMLATATSTAFQDSSVVALWTDNYFLQCMKSPTGLVAKAQEVLHAELIKLLDSNDPDPASAAALKATLSSQPGQTPVQDMTTADFATLTSEQLCNAFYFSIFPRRLVDVQPNGDVTYIYDGTKWIPNGEGPYFKPPTGAPDKFPEDSLQMFVGTNDSTPPGVLQKDRDMILIGPNTQTYATFRPVIVYGNDRYDISSSTTNLRGGDVFSLFGYWLRYRIFYNYVRFVTDEWYRESTYPAGQWIVDLTGYATLFTGASLFSLLLLPLLRTMRRREKQRLLKQRPEVYLWGKHRRKVGGGGDRGPRSDADGTRGGVVEDDAVTKGTSVMLPGFNV